MNQQEVLLEEVGEEECEQSVPKHWAEAWRQEGAWRIDETKCLYTDLYTSLQLCNDACSGRKEGALTAGPLEAYLTPSLPWLVPTASSPP